MTSGTTGANTPPEDDDPFGYLYADGQANGAQPPSGGYGYPGSVNRVRAVGQRQYGQPQQQSTAPYGQVPQQQGAHGQPHSAHYAAPETFPGGAPTSQHPQQGYSGGGRGRGPNTKGLLIGAIAVVAAVVIGIGVAMLGGDGDDDASGNQASSTPSAQQSSEPSASASSSEASTDDLPETDAKALKLGTGVTTASDVQGASSDGGIYVTGFNTVGASVTWNVSGIPKSGKYTLYVGYGVPGKDANATLSINGTAQTRPVNLANFAKAAEGDYAKGWTSTWSNIQLNQGTNVVKISCEQGNSCDFNLDQLRLEQGWRN